MSQDLFLSIKTFLTNANLYDKFLLWAFSQIPQNTILAQYSAQSIVDYLNIGRTINDWISTTVSLYSLQQFINALKVLYGSQIYADAREKMIGLGYAYTNVPVERLDEAKALIDEMLAP